MTNTNHTLLPWIAKLYEPDEDGRPHWGVRQSPNAPSVEVEGEALACGFCICSIIEQDMGDIENGIEAGNAAFIAHACNNHDALVKGFDWALNWILKSPHYTHGNSTVIKEAKQILADATKGI